MWSALFDFGNLGNDSVSLHFSNTSYFEFATYVNVSVSAAFRLTCNVQTNQWYHVALALRGNVLTFYLNGVQLWIVTGFYIPKNVIRNYNYIGKSMYNWPSNAVYDEIKIYNVSLSSANISLDMSTYPDNSMYSYLYFDKFIFSLILCYFNSRLYGRMFKLFSFFTVGVV